MKVVFAKNIGFCSGVKRAMIIAEKSLERDPKPVQFLGPLIHNEEIIKELKRRGGKIVSNLKQVKSGTLIIRAHGVSPILFEKIPKSVLVRDATCPLVKNTQLKALKLFREGYQVVVLGARLHPEVIGIKGYTENKAIVIENKNQIKILPKFNKIGFLAQTTQDVGRFKEILKILKSKAKETKWFNTICPEVMTRQKELNKILKRADGILIIGSRASANTKRLVERVKESKKTTTHPPHPPARSARGPLIFWVNSLNELKRGKIKKVSALGVVSGTSTPNWEIEKIKKWLKDAKQK